jgi:hypothetical protein
MKQEPIFQLPRLFKTVNAIDIFLRNMGINLLPLEKEKFIKKAQKTVGATQFENYPFDEAMDLLIPDCESSGDISILGRFSISQNIQKNLEGLLKIRQTLDEYPEVLNVKIDQPVIILGLPRTGSTFLHNLMAQGSGVRSPKLWELVRPCPPPAIENDAKDPRFKKNKWEMTQLYQMSPIMKAMHDMEHDRPDECVHLFMSFFACPVSYYTVYPVKQYFDYVSQMDMTEAYLHYKKLLQVLSLNYPGKDLVLKSPGHFYGIPQLISLFPNARYVVLHRDPKSVMGSVSSITETMRTVYMQNAPDTKTVGEDCMKCWGTGLDKFMDSQNIFSEQNVFHLGYNEFVKDPLASVKKIYERFGLTWDENGKHRMEQYIENNPKTKHGAHKYSIERYHLTENDIQERFKPYLDAFAEYL